MRVQSICLAAIMGLGAMACDTTYSMTGTWRQTGELRDSLTGDSHVHFGTYNLGQTGDSFTGVGQQSGVCTGTHGSYTGPLSDNVPFPVTEGHIVGSTVSFKTNVCSFTGSFEDGNSNRISGTGTCSYALNGTTYHFAGQWQADR
jgi:hypothetical protein